MDMGGLFFAYQIVSENLGLHSTSHLPHEFSQLGTGRQENGTCTLLREPGSQQELL
jgi:hypothetical protein